MFKKKNKNIETNSTKSKFYFRLVNTQEFNSEIQKIIPSDDKSETMALMLEEIPKVGNTIEWTSNYPDKEYFETHYQKDNLSCVGLIVSRDSKHNNIFYVNLI